MSQMSDLGAVSSQTSVDAAALITNQHTSINRGPARLCNTDAHFTYAMHTDHYREALHELQLG